METRKSISRIFSVLILFMFLLTGVLPAQAAAGGDFVWAKSMGGTGFELSGDIAVDAAGNVYTTGGFEGTADFDPGAGTTNLTSAGGIDVYISKLDTNGNFVWAKGIGGVGFDNGDAITLDSGGNIYTTGTFFGTVDFDPGAGASNLTAVSGDGDIFVSKLDRNGNFVWAKQLGSGEGYSVAVDASWNVYTTGFGIGDFDPGPGVFNLPGSGEEIFISKLDSSGNFVRAKGMAGPGIDDGWDIAVDPGGNVYTCGTFQATVDFDPGAGIFNLASAGGTDMFLSKLDNNGNFLWAKSTGGIGSDFSYSLALDATGNIYSTGRFEGTVDFDPDAGSFNLSATDRDIFLSKLDAGGNFLWAKGMGGTGYDSALNLAVDAGGSAYIGGHFENTVDFDPSAGIFNLTSAGLWDDFVAKFGNHGNFIWAKGMGGVENEFGTAIAVDASRNVYASGSFSGTGDFDPGPGVFNLTSAGSNDIFVTKLDHDNVLSRDTTGVFRPSNGVLFLKNDNTTGIADIGLNYGIPGDYPVVGDWDGDGKVTIGIYRNGSFYLRNSNTIGFADMVFAFGQPGDQPVAGDWNGDGVDTIGVYHPANGQFLLRNSNSAGPADTDFFLGVPGDVGITGDWNGDGKDTTGVFRPSNGIIFLKNDNTTGIADIGLNYGIPGDQPVTGDWDNDGIDTIGVYRNAQFMLRNSNTVGFADLVFGLGIPGDRPIAGNWDGQP